MTAQDVQRALRQHANADDAVFLQRFFKTREGEYGAGDVFIGVRVPATRQICKAFRNLPLAEVQKLLDSSVHEDRLAALIILANRYAKESTEEQEAIFALYLKNVYAGRVNNWDLIDTTAEYVVGAHEQHTDRAPLRKLAQSDDLWQRRVAIMSAFRYLKQGDPSTTLELAEMLVQDTRDLIQKAVGWQLREMGKRIDRQLLLHFLDQHAATMPRTALRYALEHLPPAQKAYYMALKKSGLA